MNGKGKLFYVLGKIFISLRLDERRNGKKINVKEIFVHFPFSKRRESNEQVFNLFLPISSYYLLMFN